MCVCDRQVCVFVRERERSVCVSDSSVCVRERERDEIVRGVSVTDREWTGWGRIYDMWFTNKKRLSWCERNDCI